MARIGNSQINSHQKQQYFQSQGYEQQAIRFHAQCSCHHQQCPGR